jgi:MSHA type pilus biogenesis protein MshL
MKKLWITLWVGWSCVACAASSPPKQTPVEQVETLQKFTREGSETLGRVQSQMRDELQHKARTAALPDIEPVRPVYDPLEDRMVSFSMVDETIQSVLYALAKVVGMNIILDPAVTKEDRRLTMHFEKVSAARVMREILGSYDLYYQAEGGVIRVLPYQEKIFTLNFLNTETNSEFSVGGDVLGVGASEAMGGLSGNVKLTGRSAAKSNVYDVLEENLKTMASVSGKYTLNRISGTLYVKDTPAVTRAVGRLVNHLQEMLDRQILIEARIIEVALTNEHRYGIDWAVLRDSAANLAQSTMVGWSAGAGLIFKHEDDEYTIGSMVDALDTFGNAHVIANPSIRSKHAKPAVISVGTSYTYKKSVRRTRTSTSATDDISSEVEVSTVFDGLILGVIPFIEEDGRISLVINPIQSEVDQESLKPEVVQGTGTDIDTGNSISLPEVRIKEISTTISLRNSEVAILGGLIDRRKVVQDQGVPFLSKVPLLKYLFQHQVHSEQARELVIVLSVSMV